MYLVMCSSSTVDSIPTKEESVIVYFAFDNVPTKEEAVFLYMVYKDIGLDVYIKHISWKVAGNT